MSFIEAPRFPEYISYGASGGPEYKTDVVVLDSGHEQRNVRWSEARARYTVEMPLRDERRAELIAFFRAMKGRGHAFRLKDWADYTVDISNGRLGIATTASGVPSYQLYKYYAQGLEELRPIRKPVSGKVTIYRAGVAQTAGNYALDTTTGILTFVSDATQNVTGVSIAASAVVTLANPIAALTAGKLLYLTGLGGSVGAVLNDRAHTVTNVASNQYTIGTSTAGRAYTSGGTGRMYAQATEVLAWAGEFDVPVRFDADHLVLTVEAPTLYRAQAVQLIEVRV